MDIEGFEWRSHGVYENLIVKLIFKLSDVIEAMKAGSKVEAEDVPC
jgi:hypothetical protein